MARHPGSERRSSRPHRWARRGTRSVIDRRADEGHPRRAFPPVSAGPRCRRHLVAGCRLLRGRCLGDGRPGITVGMNSAELRNRVDPALMQCGNPFHGLLERPLVRQIEPGPDVPSVIDDVRGDDPRNRRGVRLSAHRERIGCHGIRCDRLRNRPSRAWRHRYLRHGLRCDRTPRESFR